MVIFVLITETFFRRVFFDLSCLISKIFRNILDLFLEKSGQKMNNKALVQDILKQRNTIKSSKIQWFFSEIVIYIKIQNTYYNYKLCKKWHHLQNCVKYKLQKLIFWRILNISVYNVTMLFSFSFSDLIFLIFLQHLDKSQESLRLRKKKFQADAIAAYFPTFRLIWKKERKELLFLSRKLNRKTDIKKRL